MIEWREIEHEDVDMVMHGYLVSQKALQRCGIYKFLNIGSMRDQPRLLQILIKYWDRDTKAFTLDGIPLKLEVEYIYFITGLSCRGKVVNIRAHRGGGA